jgi:transposase
MAKQTKATLQVDELDVVADRGYFNSEEILACDQAGITVTLPKPMTSGNRAKGRFVKEDFRYLGDEDVYICPAGERLTYRYRNEEKGLKLRRYWTNACQTCAIKQTARRARNAASRAGSTKRFSKPSSDVWTRTRKPCASAARRSSIPLARSRHGWDQLTS